MLKDKFLIYALSLHFFVGSSALLFNFINSQDEDITDKKVKISVDVSNLNKQKEILEKAIQTEVFSEEEISLKIKKIQENKPQSLSERLRKEHEIEEYKKELQAIKKRKLEEAIRVEKAKKEAARRKELELEREKQRKEAERIKKMKAEKEAARLKAEEEKKLKLEEKRIKEEKLAEELKNIEKDIQNKNIEKQKELKKVVSKKVSSKIDEREKYINSKQGKIDLLNYFNMVYGVIDDNWIQPYKVKSGDKCIVHITQSRKGVVEGINFVDCPKNNEYRKEIEKAIYKSSPLPLPKNNFLFDSKIEIIFE